jgi:signal peptidase II
LIRVEEEKAKGEFRVQRKYRVALGVCLAGAVVDQAVKRMVERSFPVGQGVDIITGFLSLHHTRNTGMVFGLLRDLPETWRTSLFSLVTIAATAIIAHLLRQAPVTAFRFPLAVGSIMAGAFGNLADRLRCGYVIDYMRISYWPPTGSHWPIFNLADAFITVGIVLLVFDTIFPRPREPGAGTAREDAYTEGGEGKESGPVPVSSSDAGPADPAA